MSGFNWVATRDGQIYDVPYREGQAVDTSDWDFKQLANVIRSGVIVVSVPKTIDQLADVSTAGAREGNFLRLHDKIWVPATASLSDLTDVSLIPAPADGDGLLYDLDARVWRPAPAAVAWNPRGAWDAGTTYQRNDLVTYAGGTYLALATSIGVQPDTDSSVWLLLAAPGEPGLDGGGGTTILSGTGSPSDSLGEDGDFYIDTSVWDLYGPKAAGSWPAGVSLIGPPGDNAANGTTVLSGSGAPSSTIGTAGDFYIDKVAWSIYGPKTSAGWPAGVSLVGPQGATGATGAAGSTGATGAAGAAGPGVAAGGTTGQLLKKASSANYDTAWTAAPVIYVKQAFSKAGALTVAAGASQLPISQAATITDVRARVSTAPTGAAVVLDVKKNGVTIFTTTANRPTIAAGGNGSTTSLPDVVTLAAGDYLSVDVLQIGSTIAGSDLVLVVTMSV